MQAQDGVWRPIREDTKQTAQLALIAYAQHSSFNAKTGVLALKFGLRFYLHPYFVYERSKGSGECERLLLADALSTKLLCAFNIMCHGN